MKQVLVLLSVAALLASCDALWPAPSEPPPKRWTIRDEHVLAVLERERPCVERLDALIAQDACRLQRGVRGDEAVCDLRPPFLELRFGCGATEQAKETLSLVPNRRGYLRFLERVREGLGSCRLSSAHLDTPRFVGDHGALVCFFGELSSFRHFESLNQYPSGLFFEYDPRLPEEQQRILREKGAFALDAPTPLALRADTSMLDEEESAQVWAKLQHFFERLK
ncbi:MAG: hypothetical protein RBU37_03205 [Myxococcota bacterium]|nr:hypothetical protein [Myxococcota bacterium]